MSYLLVDTYNINGPNNNITFTVRKHIPNTANFETVNTKVIFIRNIFHLLKIRTTIRKQYGIQ